MFKIVRLKDVNGEEVAVFTGCGETGYSAKDVMTMPGAYDECISSSGGSVMKLCRISGGSSTYRTECFALVVPEVGADALDLTSETMRVIMLPTTAANAMMQSMSAELREDVRQAVDSIHYYESLNENSKICLPDEAMESVDPAVAASMRSARQTYVLKATENQEIFQKTFDAEFGIRLPSLEDIHSESGFKFNGLDILRVTMPYRRPGTPTMYEPIYHTPYYKVGQFMGMVPPYLQWLDGYASNDLLELQPNERHMQRNLYTLYQSDVARYVAEMVTGVFLNTNFGAKLNKLRLLREKEVIDQLVAEIRADSSVMDGSPAAHCDLTTTEIEELWSRDWNPTEVGRTVKSKLTFDEGYLEAIVKGQHQAKRIVTTSNLMFVVTLDDAQEQLFTSLFIERGFISHELHEFFLRLCQRAYEVNWGHTGAIRAIPPLVYENGIPDIAREFTQYLNTREAGKAPTPQEYMSLYRGSYGDPTVIDDDDAVNVFTVDKDDDEEGTVSVAFDYYVTKTTQGRMIAGELDFSSMQSGYSGENNALDKDTRTIERWRLVNGNSNLVYFLTGAYMRTADVMVYIQSFIRLLRWGERRPKVLALPDYKEVRTVFDLCSCTEGDNTFNVDESALIKVNGCDYSLAGFLHSTTNNDINPQFIVGFLLEKNYGTVVKQYLASWEDLAEMIENCAINIGEFKAVSSVNTDVAAMIAIESFEKKSYEIYESDKSIKEGLTWKVRGREMSRLFLLTRPQITSERNYIRSTMNDTVVLPIDKKYDNLHRYVETLRRFYKAYGDKLSAIKTTMDLQDLATLFGEMVKAGAAAKQDHNERAAASALTRMELDMGGATNSINYSTAELSGKFILVNDGSNLTIKDNTWEPIEFTDPQVKGVAKRPGVSIVLLLHKTTDCWVLCRKNITPTEVDLAVENGKRKIRTEAYARLKPQIDSLLRGGSATYAGMPLKLHLSAKLER